MKKLLIILTIAFIAGCSTLHLETTDGTKTFKLDYTRRISGLQLTKATITPNEDGSVTATLEGVKTDNQAFSEVLTKALDKIP